MGKTVKTILGAQSDAVDEDIMTAEDVYTKDKEYAVNNKTVYDDNVDNFDEGDMETPDDDDYIDFDGDEELDNMMLEDDETGGDLLASVDRRIKENRKELDSIRDIPMADDPKFQEIKRLMKEGSLDIDATASQSFEMLMQVTDAALDIIMNDPYVIGLHLQEEEKERKAKNEKVDIDKLLKSLAMIHGIVSETYYKKDPALRRDIGTNIRYLMKMIEEVFEDETVTENQIEPIIEWFNQMSAYPVYLPLFKDLYYEYVLITLDVKLKNKDVIAPVYAKALDIMIKRNARLVEVIMKEKSLELAPVTNYLEEMRRKNKL